MLSCALEIGMLVMGIVLLAKGTVKISAGKELRRPGSIFVGLVMMLPLPVVFGYGFIYGLTVAASGQDWNRVVEEKQIEMALIELGIVLGCAALAAVLAFALAKPIQAVSPYAPPPPPQDPHAF